MAYEVRVPRRPASPCARLESLYDGIHCAESVLAIEFAAPEFIVGTRNLRNHLNIRIVSASFLGSTWVVGMDLRSGLALEVIGAHWRLHWR